MYEWAFGIYLELFGPRLKTSNIGLVRGRARSRIGPRARPAGFRCCPPTSMTTMAVGIVADGTRRCRRGGGDRDCGGAVGNETAAWIVTAVVGEEGRRCRRGGEGDGVGGTKVSHVGEGGGSDQKKVAPSGGLTFVLFSRRRSNQLLIRFKKFIS